MKNTLYVKIIFLYLVFGLVSFLSIATLGSYLAQRHVVKETAEKLYKEANYIASNYAVQYAQNQITLRDVQAQLDAIDIYLDSNIWIIDRKGRILVQSEISLLTDEPSAIEDFDPTDMGKQYYCIQVHTHSF